MSNYDQEKEDQRQNKAKQAATKRDLEFIENDEEVVESSSKKLKYSDE